jgi:ATP-binding cassette, subfamily B, bacterial
MSVRYWEARDQEIMSAGLRTMARELPVLIGGAVRVAWQASRMDTVATGALNLAAGVFTTFALLATNAVLVSLFATGPTASRVRAALPVLALVAAAAGVRAGLLAAAGWAQARLKPQVERLAETRLLELTSQVPLAAFDDSVFHGAMQRARDKAVPDSALVVEAAVNALNGATGVLATVVTLGVLQPVLMPLLLITAGPGAWAALRSARLHYAAFCRVSAARRRKYLLSDLMAERAPAAELRAFTLRGYLLAEYDKVAGQVQRTELDVARTQAAVMLSGSVLTGITTGAVYCALGGLLAAGLVPLAVTGTAVLTIRAGGAALTSLTMALNKLYERGLYFGEFLSFCELARHWLPAARTGSARAKSALAPAGFERLTASGVTFTYPGASRPALLDVSVTLRRGEVIALVGENGSGKTTLARLLGGLYRPDAGTIRWDDTDLADIDDHGLRERVSVIPQDHTRWPLSVRDNIVMGRDLDQAKLAAAVAEAGAGDVIGGLANGYDTLLDRRFEGGHDLSGGQWQRIAVARGFYRDAPLMIFDEPTSALDARAEHALFERIRDRAGGQTVLLITHRLASVRYADRIYVLRHGELAEQGTHAELIRLGGRYAQLYELQASAYGQAWQVSGLPPL